MTWFDALPLVWQLVIAMAASAVSLGLIVWADVAEMRRSR